jgi:hypothetical protein
LDSDLVGGKLNGDALEQEIFLGVTDARAGDAGSSDSINNVNAVGFLELVAHHEAQGAGIEQFHVGRKGAVALQVADEMDAKPFVREEQVARAEDEGLHPTLMRVMGFPSGSMVWTAQAMQGSKEWMVRRTSRGFSGSTTGLPTRDAS